MKHLNIKKTEYFIMHVTINLINIIVITINSIISLPNICLQGLCKVLSKCRTKRWLQPQRSEH